MSHRSNCSRRSGSSARKPRDEIDRLIGFLDKTDDYVSRELEESQDDEPSLGWPAHRPMRRDR
jgi:hypothetical protein